MPNQSTLADWPAIPPVPVPIIPVVPPLAPEPVSLLLAPSPPAFTSTVPSPPAALPPLPPPPRPATPTITRLAPPRPAPPATPPAPVGWRPGFAAVSGAAILAVAVAITLPLWLAVYRTTGHTVGEVLALCMMLLGTFLAGLASWAMLIELRGRVRVGDAPTRTGGVWAQVAMLIVALGLFVVAAALSLP